MTTPGCETTPCWTRRHVAAVILITVFVTEIGVMFLLPVLLPQNVSPWIEALADAALLGLGSMAPLWFLLIRPMKDDLIQEIRHSQTLMKAMD